MGITGGDSRTGAEGSPENRSAPNQPDTHVDTAAGSNSWDVGLGIQRSF
jgi:hypothetical protein